MSKLTLRTTTYLFILLLCGLTLALHTARAPEEHAGLTLTGRTMGTTYAIQLSQTPSLAVADQIEAKINEMLDEINGQMSTYSDHSELTQFNNRSDTQWHPVSRALAGIVAEALDLSHQTQGTFDVTVGGLVDLWGFGPLAVESSDEPAAHSIAEARRDSGFLQLSVRLDPPALRKLRPALRIDLSAIAKGYAVDQVASLLDRMDYVNYLVEIGGEFKLRGSNPQGSPWRIAIERPTANQHSIQRVISPGDGGIATSGDYRNFRQQNGKRVTHGIDIRNGRPMTYVGRSVTVLHTSSMRADALATALFVMPLDQAYSYATQQNIAALFLTTNSGDISEHATPAFNQKLARQLPNATEVNGPAE